MLFRRRRLRSGLLHLLGARHDLDQAEPDTTATPGVMPRRCPDCAYLRKSPERSDEYTAEWLDRIAATGERFWCHDGMRRPAS